MIKMRNSFNERQAQKNYKLNKFMRGWHDKNIKEAWHKWKQYLNKSV